MTTIKQVEIWQGNACRYTGHTHARNATAAVRRQALKRGAILRSAWSRYVVRTVPDRSAT